MEGLGVVSQFSELHLHQLDHGVVRAVVNKILQIGAGDMNRPQLLGNKGALPMQAEIVGMPFKQQITALHRDFKFMGDYGTGLEFMQHAGHQPLGANRLEVRRLQRRTVPKLTANQSMQALFAETLPPPEEGRDR